MSKLDETDPGKGPKYSYGLSPDPRYIIIFNGSTRKLYAISVLRFMARSTGLPGPVRDMAREALEYFHKEERDPEEIVSDTIVTIEGIKVYLDLMGKKFLATIAGKLVRRSDLSDLEKEIKAHR